MADKNRVDDNTQIVPRPDPTVLTTKLTEREIAALREIIEGRLEGLQELLQEQISGRQAILETRFNEMDKAIILVREEHRRFLDQVALFEARTPLVMDEKIRAAIAVTNERFTSIATQFDDSKVAVQAALEAAKEAVTAQQVANTLSIDKSERATTKQIDQITLTMQTSNRALEDKIATGNAEWTRSIEDIKARMNRMEGMGLGRQQQMGQWIAGAGLLIAAAVLLSKFL